jgi:putative endonuclease
MWVFLSMTYYTYILYSDKFDRFYYGQTEVLKARIAKHNKGSVISTTRYLPWKLYAYIELESRSEALLMEKKLKNLKSRLRVSEFIKKHGFTLIY